MQLRVHFDGRVLVPDGPVNLPVGQTFILFFNPEVDMAEFPRSNSDANLDEPTRRENMYSDDDERL